MSRSPETDRTLGRGSAARGAGDGIDRRPKPGEGELRNGGACDTHRPRTADGMTLPDPTHAGGSGRRVTTVRVPTTGRAVAGEPRQTADSDDGRTGPVATSVTMWASEQSGTPVDRVPRRAERIPSLRSLTNPHSTLRRGRGQPVRCHEHRVATTFRQIPRREPSLPLRSRCRCRYGTGLDCNPPGAVAELADAPDLGSGPSQGAGSSPVSPIFGFSRARSGSSFPSPFISRRGSSPECPSVRSR